MANVGIFYDHLEYFMDIWYNLWLVGIVCGHLLYFSQFGMLGPRKIWQPCSAQTGARLISRLLTKLASFSLTQNLTHLRTGEPNLGGMIRSK
jgi:hypothetical protein